MARPPYSGDDDEPWLAEGVREERSTLVPRARLFGGGVIAVALAALVAIGVYLAAGHKSDGSSGYANPADAPLIAADAGPYKVAPDNPGGAQITGVDNSVAGVARGVDEGSAIAGDEAEEPLARPVAGAPPTPPTDLLPPSIPPPAATAAIPTRPIAVAPVVAPAAKPAPVGKPEPVKAKPPRDGDPLAPPVKAVDTAKRAAAFDPAKTTADVKPAADATRPEATAKSAAGGPVTLQLGAFSTRDKAEAAWTKAGSDGALAGLTKRIEPIDRDGATLYRLRAGGVASKAAATALCSRLGSAGNACIVTE